MYESKFQQNDAGPKPYKTDNVKLNNSTKGNQVTPIIKSVAWNTISPAFYEKQEQKILHKSDIQDSNNNDFIKNSQVNNPCIQNNNHNIHFEAISGNMRCVVKNVSFKIKPGKKIAVMGNMFSGKSYLLLGLLGELALDDKGRKVSVRGRINYLSSEWHNFIEGSIRENICLSDKYNPAKFKEVLKLVDLDLKKFPGEDYFEVADHAPNFS